METCNFNGGENIYGQGRATQVVVHNMQVFTFCFNRGI